MKHLTVHNQPPGGYISRFLDFFESATHFYLVTEKPSGPTLKDFIHEAHVHLANGRLTQKEYAKVAKYILWQLVATVKWMHDSYQCTYLQKNTCLILICCVACSTAKGVHLALCPENIFLCNARFDESEDGSMSIPLDISINLTHFDLSEKFNVAPLKESAQRPRQTHRTGAYFECHKKVHNAAPYQSPEQMDDAWYDAKAADMFCIGQVMFAVLTGTVLYDAEDVIFDDADSGYRAMTQQRLKQFLIRNDMLRYFKRHSFSMLCGLLRMDERRRSVDTIDNCSSKLQVF